MRLASWLALGASVADLNRPESWKMAIGCPGDSGWKRPFAVGGSPMGTWLGREPVPCGKVAACSPRSNRRPGGHGSAIVRGILLAPDSLSDGGSAVGELLALIGARFELDHADVALAGLGRVDGDGGFFPGGSLLARVHSDRRESVMPGETIAQIKTG